MDILKQSGLSTNLGSLGGAVKDAAVAACQTGLPSYYTLFHTPNE